MESNNPLSITTICSSADEVRPLSWPRATRWRILGFRLFPHPAQHEEVAHHPVATNLAAGPKIRARCQMTTAAGGAA